MFGNKNISNDVFLGSEMQQLSDLIDQIRRRFVIQNGKVADELMTMDEFDKHMQAVCKDFEMKSLVHLIIMIGVIVFLYNCLSKSENDLNLQRAAFLLVLALTTKLVPRAVQNTINFHPLFSKDQRELVQFNKMRKQLKQMTSLNDLKDNAKIVNDCKIANCYGLCIAAMEKLEKLDFLHSKYLTLLILRSSQNKRHEHAIIVASNQPLNVTSQPDQTIENLDDTELLFIDPWYNKVLNKEDIKKLKQFNKCPLLFYPLHEKVYEHRPKIKSNYYQTNRC